MQAPEIRRNLLCLEGLSNQIVERMEISQVVDENEIISALGNPEDACFGAWPVTPELERLVIQKSKRSPFRPECDYFAEYQIELAAGGQMEHGN